LVNQLTAKPGQRHRYLSGSGDRVPFGDRLAARDAQCRPP
jgi:hypothetical protein